MSIKDNKKEILKKIKIAAEKSNRTLDDITIIAVTKTVGIDKINEIVENNIFDIGENRVQEINKKYGNLNNNNVRWHMIGHLQTNKVKYIIDKVDLIHSAESIKLAKEIDKKAGQHNIIAKILIEINIGEEESKYGIKPSYIKEFINELKQFKNIKIYGIMTVAPYDENPEKIRWMFKKMKTIFDEAKLNQTDNIDMQYLSMGMTNDYEIAIEEGSNMIRIGTGFFGERNY